MKKTPLLLLILSAGLALACGGSVPTTPTESATAVAKQPTRQAPLTDFQDFIWVDTDRSGDASGNRLFDLAARTWYAWDRALGGYALPETELANHTLLLANGRYAIQPAPPASFSLPRGEETADRRLSWGMALGEKYVLLQQDIRQQDEDGSWQTTSTLHFAPNEADATVTPLPNFPGLLSTPGHQLNQHALWSPDGRRVALEQPMDDAEILYLFDAPTASWRTVAPQATIYKHLWSPNGELLAIRTAAGVMIYDWAADELRSLDQQFTIPTWTADSGTLLVRDASGLYTVDPVTLARMLLTETAVSGLTGSDNAPNNPGWTWYGAGTWTLVRGTEDGNLYRLNLNGGLPAIYRPTADWQPDATLLPDPYAVTAVSPDEQLIAYNWGNQLWLAPADPAESPPRLVYEGDFIRSILWAPDNQRLLFTTGPDCLPNTECAFSLRLASISGTESETVAEMTALSHQWPVLRGWLP